MKNTIILGLIGLSFFTISANADTATCIQAVTDVANASTKLGKVDDALGGSLKYAAETGDPEISREATELVSKIEQVFSQKVDTALAIVFNQCTGK